ncbi:CapA family protein [Kushneria sp. Sum13]|uniref:CapA family protein n=1 Tax=Kushneria sp. Sum13 TaxID=3459196 RepID=UPI004045BF4D
MIEMFVCGDVVNRQYNGGPVCDDAMSETIAACDYAVCNFEAPVRGFGREQPKDGPHINQQIEIMSVLKSHGFDMMLLANNHIMDFGDEALEATLREGERLDVDMLGAGMTVEKAYLPLIREIQGVRIGMINACEAQFGVLDHNAEPDQAGYAWLNHPAIDRMVIELKRECDFVVVFAHAGLEYYDIPQKEWRLRYQHLCDLGADVIVGAHPHVPQGHENHNGSLIFYSLGNFYFSNRPNPAAKKNYSYAVKLGFEKGAPVRFTPVFHHTENDVVCLSPEDDRTDLARLDALLHEDYQRRYDEMSTAIYQKYIQPNQIRSLMGVPCDGTLKGSIKEVAATLLGKRRHLDKPVLGMHLMKNETYYYAARRATELKAKRS